MRKTLKLFIVAALASLAMVSTNAFADDEAAQPAARVSSNGSYEFKPSWGIGLQYGMTFTEMNNFNDYFLVPAHQNWYDVNFVADHELYGEWTPVEGFRISLFAGFQSLYIKDTGFSYIYGGLEPAYSVRRGFFEFAVGLGLGYGGTIYDSESDVLDGGLNGHGLLLRPFVEGRWYPCDIFAIYLRVAFSYYKEFGLDFDEDSEVVKRSIEWGNEGKVKDNRLSYAGPNVALGFRFGAYAEPVKVIGDKDKDGVLDDIDYCVDEAGTEEFYGCPNPDTDGDGFCDPWVAEKGLSETFADKCQGTDPAPDEAEDFDGFQDDDGVPDPDNDGDGLCDPWVAEKGLSDKYADVCKGSDQSPDEGEDIDGFQDDDGVPDPDNDGDGYCDPWVAEKGLDDKYAEICIGVDLCPNVFSNRPGGRGCGDPDSDHDGFCDAWVYEQNLQSYFPQCKGLDRCPNETGDDNKGCLKRRVEVTADKIQINEAINFKLNAATIDKSSDSLLEEIASTFKSNPQIKKVEIQGHTDLSGNAKKNQQLSDKRAKAVYDRLVKLGVEKERLTYKGYGMSQPVEPLAAGQKKETEEQAAKNRRVVFSILEQDEVKTVMTVDEARQAGYSRNEVTLLDKQGNPVEPNNATATPAGTTTTPPAGTTTTPDTTTIDTSNMTPAEKAAAEARAKALADKAAADKAIAEAKAKAAADKAAADKAIAEAKAKLDAERAAATSGNSGN